MTQASTIGGATSTANSAHERPVHGTETRTIEDLRRLACTPVARSLALAFGAGHSRERFDASMELAESIAARACQFLNSLYLRSARDLGSAPVPQVEQRMLELGRKNLSFGDYVSSMELFLSKLGGANLHASMRSSWDELAAPLRDPFAVGEDIAALELIKQAREKYEIPVSSLERFVDDQRSGGQRKHAIASVLRVAATYRNAKAHHHAWFADDEGWYLLLLERWRRILEQVMLHPPVYRLLAAVEVVTTQAVARMTVPGQFLWDATREELDELRRPLGDTRLASPSHIVAGRHWAHRPSDDAAPLQWMFPSRKFPENVESQEQREQRYRARVMRAYLDVGTLRTADIDSTLRPLRAELGIQDNAAQQFEDDVVTAIRAAEAEARGIEDNGAMGRLLGLVRHFEADFPDLKSKLALLEEQRAQRIYGVIEDQWPISHPSLEADSEMHPEDLERALGRLLASDDPTRAVRKVEPALGKVYYRIPSTRTTEELTAAIERIRAQPDLAKALRPLLEVCRQFFLEEGHPELPTIIARVLSQSYENGAAAVNETPAEAPRLLFAVRGQTVETSSVPGLLREIVHRFGTNSKLLQKVPFASGRRRYFVAREPRHAAGHAFLVPLSFEGSDLIFEANQSRLSALKSLRQWFTKAGIPVDRVEIDGRSIDEMGTQGEVDSEVAAPASSDEDLIIQLRLDDRTEKVAGPTAGIFLSSVVELLVEEGRLTVDQLPVHIGRVRYLVAQEPKHANGRPFDSPVETEGMYIEAALTRADARVHAATLCRLVGVEVLDSDAAKQTSP